MLKKIKTEITTVCILCSIFDSVFHRILDFITRLDIYPGLFFLLVPCALYLVAFLSAFVYLFLLTILSVPRLGSLLEWQTLTNRGTFNQTE